MTNFSVISCYSALHCANKAPIEAFLEFALALIEKKQYTELNPNTMTDDFEAEFHIRIPYHPMQRIIQLGIDKGYFAYNSSLQKVYPLWDKVDSEGFMELVEQKDNEYKGLLDGFGGYLKEKHNLYCSSEDLSNQVQAFIQRYGLISKIDKGVLQKVQNDYSFAEYMIYCDEHGDAQLLNYIDSYTTGCAFAEVLTFGNPTTAYRSCSAKVYLDAGFIFALLGIGSVDRSVHFKELLNDMMRLGMKPYIFLHTYSEITGIIDAATNWIGNQNYDSAIASETAYFFVTNNWSRKDAIEFLGGIKRILTVDLKITIDETVYPNIGDIRTPFEEDIKQRIIDEYSLTNSSFSLIGKEFTIDNDARSLFMISHYNDSFIARAVPDIRYIFITMNRTLARVGRALTAEIPQSNGSYIPLVMTDLNWGTLIWANSPAKISDLNKSKIISSAYAAFGPTQAILRKLDKTLRDCQENKTLTPELCYFLKTNAVALSLLAKKTRNEENCFFERTPFEILEELKSDAYKEGVEKKQSEIDRLNEKISQDDFQLKLAKHRLLLERLENNRSTKQVSLDGVKEKYKNQQDHLKSLSCVKKQADKSAANYMRLEYIVISFLLLCYVGGVIALAQTSSHSWIITAIGAIVPILGFVAAFYFHFEFKAENISKSIRERWTKKAYLRFAFDQEQYEELVKASRESESVIKNIKDEIFELDNEIKRERLKQDEYSIDIELVSL